MRNKILIVLTSLVIAVIFLGMITLLRDGGKPTNSHEVPDKIRIKDYSKSEGVQCAALMPGCGYCPGEVVGESCYVTQTQFDEYKKIYSELEAYN